MLPEKEKKYILAGVVGAIITGILIGILTVKKPRKYKTSELMKPQSLPQKQIMNVKLILPSSEKTELKPLFITFKPKIKSKIEIITREGKEKSPVSMFAGEFKYEIIDTDKKTLPEIMPEKMKFKIEEEKEETEYYPGLQEPEEKITNLKEPDFVTGTNEDIF